MPEKGKGEGKKPSAKNKALNASRTAAELPSTAPSVTQSCGASASGTLWNCFADSIDDRTQQILVPTYLGSGGKLVFRFPAVTRSKASYIDLKGALQDASKGLPDAPAGTFPSAPKAEDAGAAMQLELVKEFYGKQGFSLLWQAGSGQGPDLSHVKGKVKVAVYAEPGDVTHAARQDGGRWRSKHGPTGRVEFHSRAEGLCDEDGDSYGEVVLVFVKSGS